MGQAKRKQYSRGEFLKEHPLCCYCGVVAVTTDHCPPRGLFRSRQWPEGYEFPACAICNDAGRAIEQVIACGFRFSLLNPDVSDEMQRLLRGVGNNHPTIFSEWRGAGGAKTKRLLNEKFGHYGPALRRQGFGAAEIGPEQMEMLHRFGDKLGRALYYKHVNCQLPSRVFVNFLSFINNHEYLEGAVEFAPILAETKRCNVDLGDQFCYRYNSSPQLGILYAVARLGEQQGYQMFVFSDRGWNGLREFNAEVATGFEASAMEARPIGRLSA